MQYSTGRTLIGKSRQFPSSLTVLCYSQSPHIALAADEIKGVAKWAKQSDADCIRLLTCDRATAKVTIRFLQTACQILSPAISFHCRMVLPRSWPTFVSHIVFKAATSLSMQAFGECHDGPLQPCLRRAFQQLWSHFWTWSCREFLFLNIAE